MTRFVVSDWHVDLPPGECDDVVLEHYERPKPTELERVRSLFRDHGRWVPEGTYTRLVRNGQLWMSDTPDEIRDQAMLWLTLQNTGVRRVLIGGLGLGISVRMALACEHVEHIDIVEIDHAVVQLVGKHYAQDERVTVYEDDILTIGWPTGTHWDVAWFDIWPTICTDNLDEIGTLNRRYSRRTGWHASWMEGALRSLRRREQREGWWR